MLRKMILMMLRGCLNIGTTMMVTQEEEEEEESSLA